MHQVQLSDSAYHAFQNRASATGLSVDEYLERVGSASMESDGFVMTPEIRAAIKVGLAQVERGETHSWDEVQARLEENKRKWREEKSH